jgi:hypothetical protein
MLSGSFLKKSIGKDNNIPKSIEIVKQYVNEEKWEEAKISAEKLEEVWKKVVNRVQFSSERDEINGFSISLARLKGAIMTEDKSGALMELSEAYEHWDELGK